ncbi:MAG: putative phosphoserine aminotransferase [Cellvibrionaceae bacterium]|jgi:predicted phosphoserine aminotransferase
MSKTSDHLRLFLPGPTEVSQEILEAQTEWMVGHRMQECIDLIGRISPKLRKVFRTESRVYIVASSGTGMWEAATRNCVRNRVIHFANGSFGDRWGNVHAANGKDVKVVTVDWGKPVTPEIVLENLVGEEYDAVSFVHNETSVGITNPVKDIVAAIRSLPGGQDVTIMVDSVSGVSGAQVEFDAWDLDILLTSSQKAFALPPGLAFAAVSDRALEKAKTVPNRGYYFDYVEMEKYLVKDQTPATPAISLLFALDKQLDRMMAETMEKRWERHLAMRQLTMDWAKSRGFEMLAEEAYSSPTVSTVSNTHGISIGELNAHLRTKNMVLSNGYGKLKEQTFRIGHMGDWGVADIQELLDGVDEFLVQKGLL